MWPDTRLPQARQSPATVWQSPPARPVVHPGWLTRDQVGGWVGARPIARAKADLYKRGGTTLTARTAIALPVALVAAVLAGFMMMTVMSSPAESAESYYRNGTTTVPGGYVYSRMTDSYWHEVGWQHYVYVSGYARTFPSGGVSVAETRHTDDLTCSAGSASISVGSGGWSITGSASSSTATWTQQQLTDRIYHYYQDSGRWKCSYPVRPAKITHRSSGSSRIGAYSWYDSAAEWSRWQW